METNNLSVQSNLYASDSMADMFDMDIFSDVTTNFGLGELFPQLTPSPDSEWIAHDFSWTTDAKRQKTDGSDDFDSCVNSQQSQVVEPPAIKEGRDTVEVAAECSLQPTVTEQSNEFKKEGLLSMVNNQTMPRQEKRRKRVHSDLVAEENMMTVSNNERVSPGVNVAEFQRPIFPYSCLIAMALKNAGELLVSQIYIFICEHFPYYRTAPSGWKNCIRHALSTNKHFVKHACGNKGKQMRYTWSLDPSNANEMDQLICEWLRKDAMVNSNEMVHRETMTPNRDDDDEIASADNESVATKDLSAESQMLSPVLSQPVHHHLETKYVVQPRDLYQVWLLATSARPSS